jgi:triacylglycerol esterase/lipase EstA (alpha/beta hydrolase family)
MNNKIFTAAVAILLSLSTSWVYAATLSDTAKEARWAEQVVPSLLDGDAVMLEDGQGHEFLGIYTPADSEKRAVILVHGIGVHPNWPDVIYPLREALLENDITSLSIQMPILENEASEAEYLPLYDEAPARLQAAVDFLKDAGYEKIDIAAHSMCSRMTVYFLSSKGARDVNSVVLIGMGESGADVWTKVLDTLAGLSMPVLDLYGEKDLENVLTSVQQRAESGSKNKSGIYRQIEVEGANHFFQGHEDELKSAVMDWLTGN